ncbi:hypothetical protein BH10PSE2_BH10PSE2_15080 [soil metagenome]
MKGRLALLAVVVLLTLGLILPALFTLSVEVRVPQVSAVTASPGIDAAALTAVRAVLIAFCIVVVAVAGILARKIVRKTR